jgi:hypothetical protein
MLSYLTTTVNPFEGSFAFETTCSGYAYAARLANWKVAGV